MPVFPTRIPRSFVGIAGPSPEQSCNRKALDGGLRELSRSSCRNPHSVYVLSGGGSGPDGAWRRGPSHEAMSGHAGVAAHATHDFYAGRAYWPLRRGYDARAHLTTTVENRGVWT